MLSRVLHEHGVAADTAESAEAALDYLKGRRPDVVFLDHMMPGMDGFEALEAIKANPVTATIPVLMYTSKEGELYVGQARALGALGVLPKNVAPVEVANVLRSLRLIPDGEEPAAPPPPGQPLDSRQTRELLEDLFYRQSATLRAELRRELRELEERLLPPPLPLPSSASDRAPDLAELVQPHAYKIATAVLFIVGVVFAYLYFATNALLGEAISHTNVLAANTAELSTATSQALMSVAAAAEPRAADAGAPEPGVVLDVLRWGFNRGGGFAFGETPLDGERAAGVAALLEELQRIGFTGTVALDVHMGRFCMSYGTDGDLELAPPALPAASCDQIGWSELEAVELGEEQSLSFAHAIASAIQTSPGLNVETLSLGDAEPLLSYPSSSYAVTAGEWNEIAARNQRVEVRMSPSG